MSQWQTIWTTGRLYDCSTRLSSSCASAVIAQPLNRMGWVNCFMICFGFFFFLSFALLMRYFLLSHCVTRATKWWTRHTSTSIIDFIDFIESNWLPSKRPLCRWVLRFSYNLVFIIVAFFVCCIATLLHCVYLNGSCKFFVAPTLLFFLQLLQVNRVSVSSHSHFQLRCTFHLSSFD